MARVEPSGVIFRGSCDVQTERCISREWGALTAVWGPPGQTQIDVCGACLEEKLRTGEWEIEGAMLRERAGHVAVVSAQPQQATAFAVQEGPVREIPGED
jgi:hypothetical protein